MAERLPGFDFSPLGSKLKSGGTKSASARCYENNSNCVYIKLLFELEVCVILEFLMHNLSASEIYLGIKLNMK